jgi:hypothetical protein
MHGGGVDRYVRDIVHALPRPQMIWHASARAEILELPGERRSLAFDVAALERDAGTIARFLRARGVGILHVHSITRAVRARAAALARPLGLRTIATLHDVMFLRADALEPDAPAGADPSWIAETSQFLRSAAAVLAPSDYVANLARHHMPDLAVEVLPNGSPPRRSVSHAMSRPQFAAGRPRHTVAVLGAIGPHKGSAVLAELGPYLAGSGIAIVVIGYLDAQVTAGWRGEHLFVHGPYHDEDLPALLRSYGVRLGLFPNRVPESFSYALSDLWDAAVPVLVPSEGALAERVRRHGGGWILPPGAGASEIAQALRTHLSPDHAPELARVESDLARADDARVPRLDAMTRSLDALYARFGIDATPPVDVESPAIQALLAKNLDAVLFRVELSRMADEYVQLMEGLEAERAERAKFAEESRAWIAKLEEDVARLQAELAREVEARRAFADDNAKLRDSAAALELLPSLLRRLLLKKIRDARG